MQKDNVITIRLSSEEKKKLETDAEMVNMKSSQYVRDLILKKEIRGNSRQPEIATLLCRIYIMLGERDISDDALMKELHELCQTLS